VPHDTRDQVVDYVRDWAAKSDIPVSLLLRWVGITSSKYHDWKIRFGQVNEHNASVPRDHWLTDDEKARIHTFARAHPLEGYRRLTFMMLDADVVACSPTSVYRVLKAANLLAGSSPVPSKKGTGFQQPLTPHEHWHIDVSYLNIAGTFYFLCSVLDGYSRAIVHHEIREKMEESDVEVILQRAREAHPGVTPRIISDNGPQFLAKDFKKFIRIAGMTHVKTSPYYPQSNGKIERWHKTLKGESIRVNVPLSLEDARRIVADYVSYYNTVRLHSAIGYITPKDKLDGHAEAIFAARDRKLAEARERRRQLRQHAVAAGGIECQRSATGSSDECQRVVTPRPAIDFEAVKSRIGIAAVLRLLGIEVTKSQHRGACPLHGSTSGTARCFSASQEKNVFHCFKCGQSGNALELWAKATQQTPYDAAVDLCQRLGIELLTETRDSRNREEEPVTQESL
jgi:transposase InsO family protein